MSSNQLELWGGVECTVNRVGDTYHQQLPRNGHLERLEDIDAFAATGIRALRTPVIWELVERSPRTYDFAAFDPMILRIRERGMRPIAGLVHHGSGPSWTSLVDEQFAPGLARYAREVAERYPWIEEYTPVNEPLTTARFSGLYGVWYPHGRSNSSFVRALLNETRATVLAMEAIRKVQPRARLIQTEDIAHVTSTPLLREEADYQNQRRWLSFDLLCGRVDRDHPLYELLVRSGASESELAFLVDHPCPPDVIGANYYFTSDRHLDESVDRYPAWSHISHELLPHADVHASAFAAAGLVGHRAVIQAVWDRYRIPVAFTEVHAGATREEQMRWLKEAWNAAQDARAAGIEVPAITAWALLGSFDWNKLVVEEEGFYEPGVFDIRGGRPRPTALATMLHDLATQGHHDHPVLDCHGWWRRERGLDGRPVVGVRATTCRARPILITGGSGTLGRAFAHACEERGLACELVDRRQLDIGKPEQVESVLASVRPWTVINAAGFVRVDEAEQRREQCLRVNAEAPALLAAACKRSGARLLTFSSDLVFDGRQRAPYLEAAPVSPLSVYGRSKAEAERRVLEELEDAMVVRTSSFFGPWDDANFVSMVLHTLREQQRVRASHDAIVSPTYVPHLVHACLDLLIDGERGIWHLANEGEVSWAALAARVAALAGLSTELVIPCSSQELGMVAPRPAYSVLGSERGRVMPSLEEGLDHYFFMREQKSA